MKCLTATGIDTAKLDLPFALRAAAGTELALSQVRLSTEFDHKLDCAAQ